MENVNFDIFRSVLFWIMCLINKIDCGIIVMLLFFEMYIYK